MSTFSTLYPFAGGNIRQRHHANRLMDMRQTLDDLVRQMSSGKKSETYGGLGESRVSSLTFRNQQEIANGFTDVIDVTTIRLQVMTRSTNEMRTLAEKARSVMLGTRGTGGYPEITSAVKQVQAQFEQIVSSLNDQHEGLYLYSGRARDVRPVVDANTMIWGDGTNAGLRQVVDERRQADIGTGNGRMLSTNVGTLTTLSEDAVGNPFGIKLVPGTAGGGMTNVTVVGPGGGPTNISFNFTGQPNPGERVTFTITLPDGKTKNIGFAVGVAGAADDTVFNVGATPADTALNLKNAIDGKLSSLASGELREASAKIASEQFFSGSNTVFPPRVQPPFATSTSYAVPGTRPTVIWYKGDDNLAVAARDTQRAAVDSGTFISFGARANEAPLRDTLVALGMFLSEDYPPNVASTKDRFDAATGRAIEIMNTTGGPNAILQMNSDFGRSTAQVIETKQRHNDRKEFLSGLLAEIENVDNEEVAVRLTSLRTQLEASYQATARVSQLSIVNYL
ncbi:MAG: hypothetical protein LCH38_02210 [Proteobacteria bacterium]|nr:hypothetical protein [Pseudomonadota bacterium]